MARKSNQTTSQDRTAEPKAPARSAPAAPKNAARSKSRGSAKIRR